VDLGHLVVRLLGHLPQRALDRQRGCVGGGLALLREGAEQARGHAHVGGLEVHVDVEIRAIAVPALAHQVGQPAQLGQVGMAE
jgi:hypothetical protein